MDNNFLTRWSLRKLQQEEKQKENQPDLTAEQPLEQTDLTNAIEPKDSAQTEVIAEPLKEIDYGLNEQGESVDLASLLVSEAAGAVKKQALRKLFMSGEFHEVDKLNDYDHDYKAVKPLAAEVVSTMRQWLNETEDKLTDDATIDLNNEPKDTTVELDNKQESTPPVQSEGENNALIEDVVDISETEVITSR